MTLKDQAWVHMCRATLDFLASRKETWQHINAAVRVVDELTTLLAGIDASAHTQATAADGKTDVKLEAHERLVDLTDMIRGSLHSFALRSNDVALRTRTSVTVSALRKMRAQDLATAATALHDEAAAHLGDLADYDITQATLDSMAQAIQTFVHSGAERDGSLARRAGARADIEEQVDTGEALLAEHLDGILERFRSSDVAFYTGYQNARTVRMHGVRHASQETGGDAHDAAPREPMQTTSGQNSEGGNAASIA